MLSSLVVAAAIMTILEAFVSDASRYLGDECYLPGISSEVQGVRKN